MTLPFQQYIGKRYYRVLGVTPGVTDAELKSAYRRLAMQHHPDRNPHDRSAEDRFKEISEAYQCLSDPERRRLYDLISGERTQTTQAASNRPGGFDSGTRWAEEDDGHEGEEQEPRSQRSRRTMRGADIHVHITLTLEEVQLGTTRSIEFERRTCCQECGGSGEIWDDEDERVCSRCEGEGVVTVRSSHDYWGARLVDCPECNGEGFLYPPCPECRGAGVKESKTRLDVKVPPGVLDEVPIRLGGAGHEGWNSGNPGNVFVKVKVARHAIFDRHGYDLTCELPISITQAVFGTTVQIPGLVGTLHIKIPRGARDGRKIRMKGCGLPQYGSKECGDMFVICRITLPKKMTVEEKALFRKLAKSLDVPIVPQRPKAKR